MRIGVVSASKFDPTKITQTLSEGLRAYPTASWVVRKSNVGAEKALRDLLPNPEVLELDPYWKYEFWPTKPKLNKKGEKVKRKIDDSALIRDYEIILGCDKVVVFHIKGSTTQRFADQQKYHPHIYIIEEDL